jgi:hypothetical protein
VFSLEFVYLISKLETMVDSDTLTRQKIAITWFIYSGGHNVNKTMGNIGDRVAGVRESRIFVFCSHMPRLTWYCMVVAPPFDIVLKNMLYMILSV